MLRTHRGLRAFVSVLLTRCLFRRPTGLDGSRRGVFGTQKSLNPSPKILLAMIGEGDPGDHIQPGRFCLYAKKDADLRA